MKTRIFLFILILNVGCIRKKSELISLVYPNNPWEYCISHNTDWIKGSGTFCNGYDTLVPTGNDTVFYQTKFNVQRKFLITSSYIDVNIQGNYEVFLNNKKLATFQDFPLTYDTTGVKTNYDSRNAFMAFIKKNLVVIPSSHLERGVNTLTIKVWHAEPVIDFPVQVVLRAAYTGLERKNKSRDILPEITITTGGKEIVDDPRITADMAIQDKDKTTKSKISIEIRGSTSQIYPKKSYSFETQNPKGKNRNISLLGMPVENDWVLSGPYADKTLMRNVLAYTLFGEMGHYSVRSQFANLAINGDFKGVYVLTEKIKRDKNRINISKNKKDDITGGYILSNDKGHTGFAFPSANAGHRPITSYYNCIYPDSADLSMDEFDYIRQYFNNFEKCFLGENNDNYTNYIDVSSFADYLLLSELSKNIDAYRLSTFYYKNKENIDNKIYMGPVWDFNLAFGMADYDGAFCIDGWVYDQKKDFIPFWWNKLLEDDYFSAYLKDRWSTLRNTIFSDKNLRKTIDNITDKIEGQITRNFERWPIFYQGVWPCYYNGPSYEDNVAYLTFWLLERARWMDENI